MGTEQCAVVPRRGRGAEALTLPALPPKQDRNRRCVVSRKIESETVTCCTLDGQAVARHCIDCNALKVVSSITPVKRRMLVLSSVQTFWFYLV